MEIWNVEPYEVSAEASELILDDVRVDVTIAGDQHHVEPMRLRSRRCAQPATPPTHLALSSQVGLDSHHAPWLRVLLRTRTYGSRIRFSVWSLALEAEEEVLVAVGLGSRRAV